MIHYHTAYGFPKHGLRWTDEEHETTEAAWAAVGEIVGENWQEDVPKGMHDGEHERVHKAYLRAAALCISGHLPANTSFDIPALDSEKDAMSYGVIACDDTHEVCSVTPIRQGVA